MKRPIKWLVMAALLILLLVVLVLASVAVLGGTDTGFRALASQLEKRIDNLDTGELHGNLGNGVSSDQIIFRNDSANVKIQGLESSWKSSCLLKAQFCLNKLTIDELDIELFSSETTTTANADIALPSIALPITFSAEDVLIKTLRIQPPGDSPVQELHDVALTADFDGSNVEINKLSTRYQNFTAILSGAIELDRQYPLHLDLELLADNIVEEHDMAANISLRNSLATLDVAAKLSGAVQATINAQLEPLEQNLPIKASLTAREAGWPLDSKAQFNAQDITLNLDGNLNDYSITLDTNINGEQIPQAHVILNGLLNTQRALLPNVAINTLDGTIEGAAALSYKEKLTWLLDLEFFDLNPEKQIPDIKGNVGGALYASGNIENGKWTLALEKAEIIGSVHDYPFKLNAEVNKSLDNGWNIDHIILDNGENQLSSKGQVGDSWNLLIDADLPRLQNLLPDLSGGLTADIAISGELSQPDIDVQASSNQISYNDVVLEGFSLKGDINRAATSASEVLLALGTLNIGTQQVNNTRVSLNGTRVNHTLEAFSDGPQKTSVKLKANGGVNEQLDWTGKLENATLGVPAHDFDLQQATALNWNNSTRKFSVDPHCWKSVDTKICLKNKVLAEPSGTAILSLDQYSLDRLNPFLPAESQVKGTLKADTNIYWGDEFAGGFAMSANAGITDGKMLVTDTYNDVATFNYNSLLLDATIDSETINAELILDSVDMGDAQVSVVVDPTSEEKPMSGQLNLAGLNISVIKAFLPQFDELSGVINAQGDIKGSLTNPEFDGDIVLGSPLIESEILPLSVLDGEITTTVKGKRAFIFGELDTNDNGTIELEGSANWQNNNWRADLTLKGNELNITQDPLVDSRINPDITINTRPGKITITGTVLVPFARIDVAELPQGATQLSSDIVIVEDIEEQKIVEQQKAATTSAFNTTVNMQVSLGKDVKLSAYGLNAYLKGDMGLVIKGSNPPQLGGEISVYDGIFKQYGQNLKADGQVLFVGPIDQSRLDIKAVRSIDKEDRTAGLHIQGNVGEPEINLFTEPADKPERAILSYIVLGRDIDDASAQEANLLASAALALAVKGGRTLGSDVADKLGISEFALETSGSGDDTELQVSGRLSDQVLLRYGQSVFESGNTLYLRYDITKKLYLEAAQGATQAVDFFYSFSF